MRITQAYRNGLMASLLVVGWIITGTFLSGCSSENTAGILSTDISVPVPSLEIRPTDITETSQATRSLLVLPSKTPLPTAAEQNSVSPPSLPVESLDFRNYFPAVPPGLGETANHLIFFSDRTGIYQIYQIDLDGSNLVQLTQIPDMDMYDMEPDWSADGKIAFTSQHVDGKWEVFVLDPDSRLPVQLTDWGADAWSLAWSPDGKSLAFVANATMDDEIYLITEAGGTPVNLTNSPDSNDFLPVWSPDGQKIAFVSNREEVQSLDIFVMNRDGSDVTRITTSEARETSPDWSPSGNQIAFVSDEEGNFEVYVMDVSSGVGANGSEPVRLTRTPAYEWSPTWSPDGLLIAFTSLRDNEENYEVYTMAPDGSNQTRLTFDPADDIIPRWWP